MAWLMTFVSHFSPLFVLFLLLVLIILLYKLWHKMSQEEILDLHMWIYNRHKKKK